MTSKIAKTTFNAGELSPYIDAREDIEKFYNGCSKLENGTVLPYGGVTKRSGTKYIATCKGKARILPFQFSTNDIMVIEMGDSYFRFYKWDARIVVNNPTGIFESNHDYSIDNTIAYNSKYYYCKKVHKSIAFDVYNAGTTYAVDSYVSYNLLVYKSLRVTVGDTPSSSPDDWMLYTMPTDNWVEFETYDTTKVVYEIYHPYALADLWDIHYVQSGDVIYMVHEDYPPQKLSRLADDSWIIDEVDFDGGAFLAENVDTAATVQFSTTTAPVNGYFLPGTTGTLTATGCTPFSADTVGSKFKLRTNMTTATQAAAGNNTNATPTSNTGLRIYGDFQFTTNTFATSEVVILWRRKYATGGAGWEKYRTFTAATSYSGTELENDVYYTFTRGGAGTPTSVSLLSAREHIITGIVEITAWTSGTVVSATVKDVIYHDSTSSPTYYSANTYKWSEGSWSDKEGYPRTLTFYEDRLWFAGTTKQPQTMWASVSGDYENLTSGANADDALDYTINIGDMSNIQWLGSRELLFVGTSSGEFVVSANNPDNPVTPTDIKVRDKSFNGSNHIQPKILNEALFFSQGQGRKLRGLRFTLASEQYEADDVTILNNMMFESPPVEFATQKIPDNILWIVREDGQLVSFTYDPKEEISAFARHLTKTTDYTLDNKFISICSVRGSAEDEIYVVVYRYINSSWVYYLEKFSTRLFTSVEDATMVDSYIQTGVGNAPITVSGASDTILFNYGLYNSGYFNGTFN